VPAIRSRRQQQKSEFATITCNNNHSLCRLRFSLATSSCLVRGSNLLSVKWATLSARQRHLFF
jgi:hypothetical protein